MVSFNIAPPYEFVVSADQKKDYNGGEKKNCLSKEMELEVTQTMVKISISRCAIFGMFSCLQVRIPKQILILVWRKWNKPNFLFSLL